jgi:hypothetical protein
MKCVNKGVIACFNVLFLLILLHPNAGQAERVDIQFDQMRLSANLDKVSLETVCHKISQESGIWINGFVSSAEILVSVQFTDLSMEEALKRILAATNYSLVFDETEAVIGVNIIGSRTPGRQKGKGRNIAIGNVFLNEEEGETPDFEVTSQALASEDAVEMETAEGGRGVVEIVENTFGHDLPVEVEMELANLEAMEKEALVEEVPLGVDEQINEED